MIRKLKYREGDWFAVPLRDGGFAAGVVARANPGGVLLGYFFGPRRSAVPTLDGIRDLRQGDAVLVALFGHLGLKEGRWPVLGRLDGWDRREWPMPVFVRYEELTGRTFRMFFDDDDPNRLVRQEQVSPRDAIGAPEVGLMGAGFLEQKLTGLLGY
jgi:hypothetical protein